MSDALRNHLVVRLRALSGGPARDSAGIGDYWNICDDAADEIERLRTYAARIEDSFVALGAVVGHEEKERALEQIGAERAVCRVEL